jgi:acyl-CoA dehydrogenase
MLSQKTQKTLIQLRDFVENECIPAEKIYFAHVRKDRWSIPPIIETLKLRAKSLGLWNLFLPNYYKESPGFTNVEYAYMCEILGRSLIAPEATNTNAPDSGNMEVLAKYGTPLQKKQWLEPLLEGSIRSAFAMTEPNVASSDATNIHTSIELHGDSWLVNGKKWYITGAGDPRCAMFLVMGRTETANANKHQKHSILIVPSNSKGITIVRPLYVFGYDDAPHGHMEIVFDNVKVPKENIILGPGRGFEIIQGRLGPGRM